MDQLTSILNAITVGANIAGGLGVPMVGLVGKLIPIFNEIVDEIAARTDKTREQIIADTGIDLKSELAVLLESSAKGE